MLFHKSMRSIMKVWFSLDHQGKMKKNSILNPFRNRLLKDRKEYR